MDASSVSFGLGQIVVRQDQPVKAVRFAPAGECLATADIRRQLRLWQGDRLVFEKDLRVRHDRFRPLDLIRALAFSPAGDLLFVAAGETIRAFDTRSGDQPWVFHAPPTFGFLLTSAQALAVSHRGVLAAAFDDGSVSTFDSEGSRRNRWSANDGPRFLSYLRDGDRLVGSDGFSVGVWDSHSGARLAKFETGERIYGLAASNARDVCAIRTLRSTRAIDLDSGETVFDFPTRPGLPNILFSPGGDRLAVAERHAVVLVDERGERVARFDEPEAAVLALTFHPDGSRILAGCSDGTVRSWASR